MKIVVTGTRGIPDIPGGVETHCEELYPRLAKMGHDVTVIRRMPYLTDTNRQLTEYKGVKLIDVKAPRKKSLEAIVHTFRAIIKARSFNPDLIHIHAIGPSIMTPFARLLGMKVVTTNHGPDYDRQKWGHLAKTVLKTGQWMGAKFSNRVIVISKVIADILAKKCGRADSDLIFNGVNTPVKSNNTDYIESLKLTPGKYIVGVGRFVEEKGFHDLINAFKHLGNTNFKLVIAGDADHEDAYSRSLKEMACETDVVLTGYIKGEPLNQLLSHAGLFCMPSYHEGLPIALLEAMSYNLDVMVSDIPACRLECLDSDKDFFPVGNVVALKESLNRKLKNLETPRQYDLSPYNWDTIAAQTEALYSQVVGK